MCRPRRWARALAPLVAVSSLACRQGMRDQPRIDPLEASEFFADGAGSREVPEGAVPRGLAAVDRHYWDGRAPDGAFATTFPFPITDRDLRRGEERYEIFCMPCHGRLGEGDGMAVRRGYPAPPVYSDPRVRAEPPGQLFDVATHGHAFMPDYDHIPVEDRWRIVAWVQVLQYSQHALVSALPRQDRDRLEELLR